MSTNKYLYGGDFGGLGDFGGGGGGGGNKKAPFRML